MNSDGGNLPEVGRTRGQKTLFDMLKADDECPPKIVVSPPASQQSTDSELHQDSQFMYDENKTLTTANLVRMSREKQLLNAAEKDFG